MKRKIIAGAIIGCVIISLLIALSYGSGNMAAGTKGSKGGRVAVVYVDGVMGASQGSVLLGGGVSGESVSGELRRAGENHAVKAVVIRLNSPGGSPAAAQEISMEIERLKEAGIVVVPAMGDTAASAAYWVAACTDKIIANPGTMTGSIGVIIETINMQELYEKVGVNTEIFKSGLYKDMGSASRPVTPGEREIFQSMIDDIYDQFVETVAEGREMDVETVRELADGRVFTGRQAKELGLVDHMGDLREAVSIAGELAGIKGEPEIIHYGRRNNFLGSFMGSFADSVIKNILLSKNMVYNTDRQENYFNVR